MHDRLLKNQILLSKCLEEDKLKCKDKFQYCDYVRVQLHIRVRALYGLSFLPDVNRSTLQRLPGTTLSPVSWVSVVESKASQEDLQQGLDRGRWLLISRDLHSYVQRNTSMGRSIE